MFFLFKFASLYSHIHHNNSGTLSVNDEWGIRERNEGNDGNAGNQGGNDGNAGNQSGECEESGWECKEPG